MGVLLTGPEAATIGLSTVKPDSVSQNVAFSSTYRHGHTRYAVLETIRVLGISMASYSKDRPMRHQRRVSHPPQAAG